MHSVIAKPSLQSLNCNYLFIFIIRKSYKLARKYKEHFETDMLSSLPWIIEALLYMFCVNTTFIFYSKSARYNSVKYNVKVLFFNQQVFEIGARKKWINSPLYRSSTVSHLYFCISFAIFHIFRNNLLHNSSVLVHAKLSNRTQLL